MNKYNYYDRAYVCMYVCMYVCTYISTYIRTDSFGLTNDWDYKNVCTKKKRLRDYFTEIFNSKN